MGAYLNNRKVRFVDGRPLGAYLNGRKIFSSGVQPPKDIGDEDLLIYYDGFYPGENPNEWESFGKYPTWTNAQGYVEYYSIGVNGILSSFPNDCWKKDSLEFTYGSSVNTNVPLSAGISHEYITTVHCENNFTFELSFRFNDINSYDTIIGGDGNGPSINLFVENDNLKFGSGSGINHPGYIGFPLSELSEEYNHLICTNYNGACAMYLDGVLKVSGSSSNGYLPYPIVLGGRRWGDLNSNFYESNNFSGNIRQFKLYKRALNSNEVVDSYNRYITRYES